MSPEYQIGRTYTRSDLFDLLGVRPQPTGGNWFTGYNQHDGDWYVFANVGVPGRTGHDYVNRWVGDELQWEAKTGTRWDQPAIQSLTGGTARVHIFTRSDDRAPFVYEGLAVAARVEKTVPVRAVWRFTSAAGRRPEVLPEEVVSPALFVEGAVRTVTVNVYERDPAARRLCLAHYGTRCSACNVDLGEVYGELGHGFIHVHHVRELSSVGGEYDVDPVKDLRPLCPNCHAIAHRVSPALTVEQLKDLLVRHARPSGAGR
jgi:5-methylcytosine-specific restriction protein A